MNRELDEKDLERLLRRNRPTPPPPPAGEYARILAAASSTAPRGFLGHLPWALAATLVLALAATFTLGGDKPPAVNGARDTHVEAFLSDTLGEVMADQPERITMEPMNGWDALLENSGR
ncbi:MAG: hypothetical protein HZA03_06240 [Nitrospinae bacterium]|nr:hypothetical protein [Nitrospinota bacterium]